MDTTTESPATTFELIGSLQARVMAILWADPLVRTVGQVHERLNLQKGAKPLAYTTVLTVMRNLARRGLVSQEKSGGRAHTFLPLIGREDYQRAYVRHSIDTIFQGSSAQLRMALSFVEEN